MKFWEQKRKFKKYKNYINYPEKVEFKSSNRIIIDPKITTEYILF